MSENHLGLRLLRQQEESSLPEGTILDQLPRPQQAIRSNQNVFVTISVKQRVVPVSDFWGKREQDILSTLAKSGLEAKVVRVLSSCPSGICIGQYPTAGQGLSNEQVLLYISAGPSSIAIMPTLKGFLFKNIQELMQKNDVRAEIFHVGSPLPDHTCEQCLVVDQQPEPGAIVDLTKSLLVQLRVAQSAV